MMQHILIKKDLAKRTISDKIFKYKVYEITINPKFGRYQKGSTKYGL